MEQNGQLNIPADPSGALAFTYGKATATPGSVTLVMPNKSSISHDISVKGNGMNQNGPVWPGRHVEGHRQPAAGHLRVLLLRAGPRGGRDEGHPHRQVAGRGGAARASLRSQRNLVCVSFAQASGG